ncbi:hypothetical protein ABZ905_11975 [Streptomyces parvus]|uniref:hypothetical protein n=1 Tax=Streptomyces parvus TaxID=66428 RepID=UPI0033E8E5E4
MLTEVALQHRVIPGIAEFARGGLPSPAATDDSNEWVDEHRPAGSTRPSESAEVGQSASGKRTGRHRGQSRLFRRN